MYIEKVLKLCEEGTTLIGEYLNAKTKIKLQCKNGHIRERTTNEIVSRNLGRNCKECAGKIGTKFSQQYVNEVCEKVDLVVLGTYEGTFKPLLVGNLNCGHEYEIKFNNLLRSNITICPICAPKNSEDTFYQKLLVNNIKHISNYTNMHTNVLVTYLKCGHEGLINPGHFMYEDIGTSCKTCNNIGDIKSRFLNAINNKLDLLEVYTTTQTPILSKNKLCSHEYLIIPNNLVFTGAGLICRICNPISDSKPEKDVVSFIKENYNGWLVEQDRSILEGKELDIVLPDLGLAFEYNGSYWHSEEKLGKHYHLNKTKLVSDIGYQLIHIMDYEWLNKQEIVKSRLLSLLGKTNKIYARKTKIKPIPFPADFLNANHIQGSGTPSKYNYGLYLEEELVAVMTFSKPRFTDICDYELIRYCSKVGITISGGASKLLRAFEKELNNPSILSYSDKRWSSGNLYKSVGFTFHHTSSPSYKYINSNRVLSRYQCQKHLLQSLVPKHYDPKLSESDIMKAAGYNKVWDCGTDMWVKNNSLV